MHRAANPRRVATRSRATDENSVPSRGAHAEKAAAITRAKAASTQTKPAKVFSEQPAKAGSKRNVLGAVTNIRDDERENTKKSAKAAAQRQPLSTRSQTFNNTRGTAATRASKIAHAQVFAQPEVEEIRLETARMEVERRDVVVEDQYVIDDANSLDSDDMDEDEYDDEDWLRMSADEELACRQELLAVKDTFQDDIDMFDTTMVAEYADEIFAHMEEMELATMPNPRYMDFQTEVEWTMRTTLVDWLLQVHLRYHLLPETLWIATNILDRFLSVRVVSTQKLQLVGLTSLFIAAKYEEILAPSVEEFVYMADNGYTKDELLKGERIILQTLDFNISSYCTPYSWVRRISKADDYDIQTRTLSKFLMEVTLLDHRFLRCKPSMIAAVGMYLSRKMLGSDWNDAFVYYSDFTEAQLKTAADMICERLIEDGFERVFVYVKYSSKKFLRASAYACDWAMTNYRPGDN